MLNRLLIVLHEGAPRNFATTMGEVQDLLSDYPDKDAAVLQVYAVTGSVSRLPPKDVTEDVAAVWAERIKPGSAITLQDYLQPYPAFVLLHFGEALRRRYETASDPSFVPDALRRIA